MKTLHRFRAWLARKIAPPAPPKPVWHALPSKVRAFDYDLGDFRVITTYEELEHLQRRNAAVGFRNLQAIDRPPAN